MYSWIENKNSIKYSFEQQLIVSLKLHRFKRNVKNLIVKYVNSTVPHHFIGYVKYIIYKSLERKEQHFLFMPVKTSGNLDLNGYTREKN